MKTPRFAQRWYEEQEEYLKAIDGNPSARIDLTKLVDRRGINRITVFLMAVSLVAWPASYLFAYLASEFSFPKVYLPLYFLLLLMTFVSLSLVVGAPSLKNHLTMLSSLSIGGTFLIFKVYVSMAGFVVLVLVVAYQILGVSEWHTINNGPNFDPVLTSFIMTFYSFLLSLYSLYIINASVLLIKYRS